MTELTHHDAEDGFHEIQLSGKQVVFAFMLTTAAAVFIFLLGVQVGRNAKTTTRADEAVEAPASASASATAGAPATPQSSTPPVTSVPAAEPPAPASEGGDKLSYATRLQSDTPPQEKLKPRSDADPAPPAHASPLPDSAKGRAAAVPKDAPKPAPLAEPPTPARPAAQTGARPGVWVVQLVALKDRGAAAAVVQRLSAKGYPAFVVSPSPGAPAIYRVQVGRYNDRREAEQVARRLEKEEQFKPWISH
ncbi:MAG TPA: SPOR domain-containing protein [Vicinamibacterales bacterium]|nr:SPOR domain-containing protein [Vicinamibacterales bacterium]